jgi:hypothetical protein
MDGLGLERLDWTGLLDNDFWKSGKKVGLKRVMRTDVPMDMGLIKLL